jgi:hypothetical protein
VLTFRRLVVLVGGFRGTYGPESGDEGARREDFSLHALLRLRQSGVGGQVHRGMRCRLAAHGCHGKLAATKTVLSLAQNCSGSRPIANILVAIRYAVLKEIEGTRSARV